MLKDDPVSYWRLQEKHSAEPPTGPAVPAPNTVTTGGTGGGSPRQVPRTIIPEVKMPATGNALYVFALPEKAR